MAEKWATKARSNKYWAGVKQQSVISILCQLIEGNTAPKGASDAIAALYETQLQQDDTDINSLWAVYCDAVCHLGGSSNSSKLFAQTLQALAQRPDVVDSSGKVVTGGWTRRTFWRDLPNFTSIFLEHGLNVQGREVFDENTTAWDEQVVPFTNATVFAATYFELGLAPQNFTDAVKGNLIDTFEQALEVATATPAQIRRANLWVPAAATWIHVARGSIYKMASSSTASTSGAGAPAPELDGEDWLWRQGRNLSSARWDFWKKRFGEISQVQGLKAETRKHASSAFQEMQSL